MKSLYFDEYLHCPLCGSEHSNHKVFYNKPYNSQEVQNFLGNYYKIRIPAEVLEGTDFQINCCRDCDFYWHQNVLNKENLNKLYSQWINFEESRVKQEKISARERMQIIHRIARQLQLVRATYPQPKVLDFGGGWGTHALCALALGCDTYLIENSVERVKFAEQKGIKVVSSIEDLPQSFFDLIIMNHVIEHIPNIKQLMTKLVSLVRVDGGCSIAVPYAKPKRKVLEKGPFQPLEHINGFTPKSLRKIVSESGLELVKDYSTYTEFSVKEIWSTAKQNIFLFFAPNKILPYKTTRLFAVKRYENFGE